MDYFPLLNGPEFAGEYAHFFGIGWAVPTTMDEREGWR
jgi:hypothetical protein